MHSTKSDIKTALYVHARMEDLEIGWKLRHPNSKKKFRGLLVTNTQYSSAAIQYSECVGFEIIAWDRPQGNSLKDIIDRSHLHPITSLTTINEQQVMQLINKGYVLCRDVKDGVKTLGLKDEDREKIEAEAGELCELK